MVLAWGFWAEATGSPRWALIEVFFPHVGIGTFHSMAAFGQKRSLIVMGPIRNFVCGAYHED